MIDCSQPDAVKDGEVWQRDAENRRIIGIDFTQTDDRINRAVRGMMWGRATSYCLRGLEWGASELEILNGCLIEIYRVQSQGKKLYLGCIVRMVVCMYIRKAAQKGFTFNGNVKGPGKANIPSPPNGSMFSWDLMVEHAQEKQLCGL